MNYLNRIILFMKSRTLNDYIQIGLLLATIWIGCIANWIAEKQTELSEEQTAIYREQMNISERQTDISERQTDILEVQTNVQQQSYEFEQEKNWSDTAKEYREKMNILYDKITKSDGVFTKVHQKIENGAMIQDINNLDNYVNEFEDIGALYCDDKIKLSDLKTILKQNIRYTCGNSQIYNRYQDSKSGLAGICKTLFPKSTGMAKFANPQKCPVLIDKSSD